MAQRKGTDPALQKALVVFGDNTELRYLKLLKPGFRHCFVILQQGECWVTCDPLSHYTRIEVFSGMTINQVETGLRHLNHTVLQTSIQIPPRKAAPISIYSCVEAVKRILGLQVWHILTPWQLYKYLSQPFHR